MCSLERVQISLLPRDPVAVVLMNNGGSSHLSIINLRCWMLEPTKHHKILLARQMC